MTDFQLYMAIGVPSFAVLLGMIINGLLFQALNSRMTALEARMTTFESRIESRLAALEATFNMRFDLLMGKLSKLDSRLSVLEDRVR